jgi:hypothetical protein
MRTYSSNLENEVHATDTLNWDSRGNLLGPTGSKTWQTYTSNDAHGGCYSRTLMAVEQVLTTIKSGGGCDQGLFTLLRQKCPAGGGYTGTRENQTGHSYSGSGLPLPQAGAILLKPA